MVQVDRADRFPIQHRQHPFLTAVCAFSPSITLETIQKTFWRYTNTARHTLLQQEASYLLNKFRRIRANRVSPSLRCPSGAPSGRPSEFQKLVASASNSLKFLTPDNLMAFLPGCTMSLHRITIGAP
jgi:hypothetical protein